MNLTKLIVGELYFCNLRALHFQYLRCDSDRGYIFLNVETGNYERLSCEQIQPLEFSLLDREAINYRHAVGAR